MTNLDGTPAKPIRVIVCGATGAVGRLLVPAIIDDPGLELVGAVGRRGVGVDVGALLGREPVGVRLVADVEDALAGSDCDVLVDYTAPDAAVGHCYAALAAGAAVFIGTTGLGAEDVAAIASTATAHGIGVFLAPNMTMSGQLMFRCAELLRPFFGDVEIVETHQPSKPDAPSGTSIETAERLSHVPSRPETQDQTRFGLPEARGAVVAGVRIHSIRSPNIYDRQEVIFSRPDEVFTIRFDQFSPLPLLEPTLRAIRLLRAQRSFVRELPGLFD